MKNSEPVITFQLFDAAATEEFIEVSLPAKFEVCHTCRGKGTRVNPSIDGNGISREQFDEDPDFAESYFNGDYDVQCSACKGKRVIAVIDLPRCTNAQRVQWRTHQEAEAESDRDWESERFLRMAESGERY